MRYEYFLKASFSSLASEFIRTLRSDIRVRQGLFYNKPISRSQQENWFNDYYSQNENHKIFIAYDDDIGTAIGYCNIIHESLHHRRAEVGYVIHPDHWNKGYGQILVNWSLDYLKGCDEGCRRVWLTVFPENHAGIHIYKKAGFKKDGILDEYVFRDGEFRNVILMSKLI
ncbi:MAG: GNAT family N-acetyltransferase [Candidatus Kariarchaeaceae archaeon]|jgi:RimJ/RimL family protein N-acetyltransferase